MSSVAAVEVVPREMKDNGKRPRARLVTQALDKSGDQRG